MRDNPVTGSQVRGRKEESPLPRAAENDRLSAPRLGQEPLFNFISQTNNNNDLVSSAYPKLARFPSSKPDRMEPANWTDSGSSSRSRRRSKKLGWLEWVGSDLKSEIESAAFARDGFTIVEVSGA